MSTEATAHTVMERCEILASYSEEPDRLTRRFATLPMRQVNEVVAQWMCDAGMTARQDDCCNLIGRYEADRPSAQTLLLGSHLDTVRDAGKYDGTLGVLIALACIERLHARNRRLPFALEVYAFANEEGLRYHYPYLGSRVVAGTFDPDELHRVDTDGVSMASAIRTAGGNPETLVQNKRSSIDLLGYCEVHIEQGPVLESLNLPIGIVSSIIGQSRFTVGFTGLAGHAGTVPMPLRRDALCAAAEFITATEQLACNQPGLVATIGQLTLEPDASNVIPGKVTLSLDVRHQDDTIRERACEQLRELAQRAGTSRQVEVAWSPVQEHRQVPCTPRLVHMLSQAVSAFKQGSYPAHMLPSGAGHDAAIIAHITDIAMLFVRCKGGVSHHPAESVITEDVAIAIAVLEQFFALLVDQQDLTPSDSSLRSE